MYDVCWIRQESKLMVQGPIVDTMIAASIIDENKMRYSLDALAKEYLKLKNKIDSGNIGKIETLSFVHRTFNKIGGNAKKNAF